MSNDNDVTKLLSDAHANGEISADAMAALTIGSDMASSIQAGLGLAPDDVPSSEVLLLTIMPDDSYSISAAGNTQLVIEGHNLVLDAVRASRQRASVLAHNRYLNGQVLYPYVIVEDAARMDLSNYNPHHQTPLYDQAVVLLGTVIAKTRELEDNGIPVRTVTLIISDGADSGSVRQSERSVRSLVGDMTKREIHTVAALGIDDGCTDFRRVFGGMGIPDQWILTTKSSDREIRRAFQIFSQSIAKVAAGSSGLGGFGA